MKIGIQTWGSYGDIRPFLALAEGLQSAGHDVTLAITRIDTFQNEDFRSQAGVRIIYVAMPVVATKQKLQQIEQEIFAVSDPMAQTQMIIEKLFLPAERDMYAMSERLCAENDLVIGHFFHYPLNAAAVKHRKPYVSVALVHSAIPSAFQAPSGLPSLGSIGNRVTWKLVKSMLNKKIKKYSDLLRSRHGIPVARDLINDVWASGRLTLVAVSPALCQPKSDWPGYYHICGFLNPERGNLDGNVSAELEAFLEAGPPPAFVTFGSAMGEGDTELISLLRKAVEMADARAIIQAPNGNSPGFVSNSRVHFVSTVPHDRIFPRCSVIVHHGGAGTTQSALRAGKPSIVIAHTSEQKFWGRELARVGVAPPPISKIDLSSDILASAIACVTTSEDLQRRASKVGAEMDGENGVVTAVKMINELFRV